MPRSSISSPTSSSPTPAPAARSKSKSLEDIRRPVPVAPGRRLHVARPGRHQGDRPAREIGNRARRPEPIRRRTATLPRTDRSDPGVFARRSYAARTGGAALAPASCSGSGDRPAIPVARAIQERARPRHRGGDEPQNALSESRTGWNLLGPSRWWSRHGYFVPMPICWTRAGR